MSFDQFKEAEENGPLMEMIDYSVDHSDERSSAESGLDCGLSDSHLISPH